MIGASQSIGIVYGIDSALRHVWERGDGGSLEFTAILNPATRHRELDKYHRDAPTPTYNSTSDDVEYPHLPEMTLLSTRWGDVRIESDEDVPENVVILVDNRFGSHARKVERPGDL